VQRRTLIPHPIKAGDILCESKVLLGISLIQAQFIYTDCADKMDKLGASPYNGSLLTHEERMMYQRILVPIDGSHTSQLALQEAIKLAHGLSAQLRLIYVLDELNYINPEGYVDFQALRQIHQETAERKLAQAVAQVQATGLIAESNLLDTLMENIEDTIDAEATRWGADLIIMGTHGRSGLNRILFGSVAEGVVRHSPVPVLLVRGQVE
jgi:nucleotide-binding universal stress UspA family protein